MDGSVISALSALGGAAIGGVTSIVGAWLSQQKQVMAQEHVQDKLRRQELYREFIDCRFSLGFTGTQLPAALK
jgi:hypothetical protein